MRWQKMDEQPKRMRQQVTSNMASKTGTNKQTLITEHIQSLSKCVRCPSMIGPVVTHRPVLTKVLLIGQAPGPREGAFGKPFAWTAGKTLFRWLETIGINEEQFRSHAYISAVCRCFPGKTTQGGDRVPSPIEIENCSDLAVTISRRHNTLPARLVCCWHQQPSPLRAVHIISAILRWSYTSLSRRQIDLSHNCA